MTDSPQEMGQVIYFRCRVSPISRHSLSRLTRHLERSGQLVRKSDSVIGEHRKQRADGSRHEDC